MKSQGIDFQQNYYPQSENDSYSKKKEFPETISQSSW